MASHGNRRKCCRAGLYARVSTLDQQTLPLQFGGLREYALKRGWTVVEEYKEVGSGVVARAIRQRLIDSAKRGDTDVILVWRLDRWGRSVADLVSTLQELTALGVGFVSVTEALDLTTPAGRAMAGLLSVFAEFERESCGNGYGRVWSMRAWKGSDSVDRRRRLAKQAQSGTYFSQESANRRSRGG